MSRGFPSSVAAIIAMTVAAFSAAAPAPPYTNPHWADSPYPITHARSGYNPTAGPTGPGRRLGADEAIWKKVGPFNAPTILYSSPYPNGKRVIWIGGFDRVAKLDADTLKVLTTHTIGGRHFYDADEIERHITHMDTLAGPDLVAYGSQVYMEAFATSVESFYRLLTRDNELILPYRSTDGNLSIQVYGEEDRNDPTSRIQLRREWTLPGDISKASSLMGMTITSDGTLVVCTRDGVLVALSRDFRHYGILKLPRKSESGLDRDLFSAFVRNNITADDSGGVYVVTRDHMHRVQWTGTRLTLDEAEGAWSAPYNNELGVGSGTSPALMGWGASEDHLVVIADAARSNNMVAFWRDQIPLDWQGLPGMDRRIAGVQKISFDASSGGEARVENALAVLGYGAFLNAFPPHQSANGRSQTDQFLSDFFNIIVPGHEARGGTQIRWDPQSRTLKTVWTNQTNFVGAVCSISAATKLVYCWGGRDHEWTLEGVAWNTGRTVFSYPLGKSHRFNPMGGPVIIAPNGAIDCGCMGGLGMARVQPRGGVSSKASSKADIPQPKRMGR